MDKIEQLIKLIYRDWKKKEAQVPIAHPSEEELACFLEGRLSPEEIEGIKAHLLSCEACAEAFALDLKLNNMKDLAIPQELLLRVKGLLLGEGKAALLEILLQLRDQLLEIINTNGDILVGQEFVPAPILRSRKIQNFKDEVTILKDFADIRVEVKIENRGNNCFNLVILAKEKQTQKILKDLRATLIKEDVELESYLTESGSAVFEHVLIGKYVVEISSLDEKLASVLLDIKV